MVVFPNAKINLGLNVVKKRNDGYHNIESVFVPIPITDALEINQNKLGKTQFSCSGIKIPSDGKANLVERAFSIMQSKYNIPSVDLDLLKQIPIGAGLGGGSADAAACILGLNDLFQLQLNENELFNLAGQLGADCAFFLKNKMVYSEGIGDEFSDFFVDLSQLHFIVVYPNIHVSTVEAYKHIKPCKPDKNIREILNNPVETWKKELKNDFEKSVFIQCPEIGEIKQELYNLGATYASMSGSGSAVFGIFKEAPVISFSHLGKSWKFNIPCPSSKEKSK